MGMSRGHEYSPIGSLTKSPTDARALVTDPKLSAVGCRLSLLVR